MENNPVETKELTPVAPHHIGAVELGLERAADRAWLGLKRHPYFGVAVTAGVTLGAATLVGIAELLITVGAGYAAYQVLKLNVPPSRAVRAVAKIEEGLI
jgi:hypothetical protein